MMNASQAQWTLLPGAMFLLQQRRGMLKEAPAVTLRRRLFSMWAKVGIVHRLKKRWRRLADDEIRRQWVEVGMEEEGPRGEVNARNLEWKGCKVYRN